MESAGDRWDREIQRVLSESSIGFQLVSQNFPNSKAIEPPELPVALRREKQLALKIGIVLVGAVAPPNCCPRSPNSATASISTRQ